MVTMQCELPTLEEKIWFALNVRLLWLELGKRIAKSTERTILTSNANFVALSRSGFATEILTTVIRATTMQEETKRQTVMAKIAP